MKTTTEYRNMWNTHVNKCKQCLDGRFKDDSQLCTEGWLLVRGASGRIVPSEAKRLEAIQEA